MCHTCMYGIPVNSWALNIDVFIKTIEKELGNCIWKSFFPNELNQCKLIPFKQTNKQTNKQTKNDLGPINQTTSQLFLRNISKIYESCILYLLPDHFQIHIFSGHRFRFRNGLLLYRFLLFSLKNRKRILLRMVTLVLCCL